MSTAEQVDNYSLDTQLRACAEYCERNGIEVAHVFREEGASAKTAQRPQLQAMLTYCVLNTKDVDFVVVHKIDRLARQLHDHQSIRLALERQGIAVRAVQETFDESPSGKFMENVVAAMAQFDNDVRSARTIDGMQEALRRGRWLWRAPLGYNSTGPQTSPSLVPDDVAAPLVKAAFDLVAEGGFNKQEALAKVTALGLRTRSGKPLSNQTFNALLRNRIYTGVVVCPAFDFEGPGDFEPLVTMETFNRVQALSFGKKLKGTEHHLDHPDFPLRRFIRCQQCDTPLTASWSKGRSTKYPYYRCRKKACLSVSVRKEKLEEAFVNHLGTLGVRPEALQLLREITIDLWKERAASTEDFRSRLRSRRDALAVRRDRLVDAFVQESKIDQTTYEDQRAKVDAEIAAVDDELHQQPLSEAHIDRALRIGEELLNDLPNCWNRMNDKQKPQFQRAVYPNGLTYDNEVVGTTEKSWLFPTFVTEIGRNDGLAVPTGFEPVYPP